MPHAALTGSLAGYSALKPPASPGLSGGGGRAAGGTGGPPAQGSGQASVRSPQSSESDGVPQVVGRTPPPCVPPAFILTVPPQAPYPPSILSPTPLSGWRKGPQCLVPAQLREPLTPPSPPTGAEPSPESHVPPFLEDAGPLHSDLQAEGRFAWLVWWLLLPLPPAEGG